MYERRSIYDDSESNPILSVVVAFAAIGVVAFALYASGIFDRGKEADDAQPAQEERVEATVRYEESDRLKIDGALASAHMLAQGGNYAEALSMVKDILDEYPDSADAQERFAEYAAAINEKTQAEAEKAPAEEKAEGFKLVTVSGGANVRGEPAGYNVVGAISSTDEVECDGRARDAYSSDGATFTWYHVVLPDKTEGWVRGDLVKRTDGKELPKANESADDASEDKKDEEKKSDDKGYVDEPTEKSQKLISGQDVNLRSKATYHSDLVEDVPAGTVMYYSGQKGEGLGSDDANHTWYYVQVENGGPWGWVRSDLVSFF